MLDDVLTSLNEDIEEDLSGADYGQLQIGTRDWTVETIIGQVLQENIDVNPHFQRRNAWNDAKRSRFLESLILGVPIPQLVLAERRDSGKRGTFIVIDGKQRLMTLAGLRDERYSFWNKREFTKLNELLVLNGVSVSEFLSEERYAEYVRQLNNWPIRCSIVSGHRTDDVLYDMFYRLNSGSVPLSGQELRQVFYKGKFANFLFDVTSTSQPVHDVLDTQVPDPRFVDVEVVLRALANELSVEPYAGNLKRFLDRTMEILNNSWDARAVDVQHLYERINVGITRSGEIFGSLAAVGRKSESNGKIAGRFNKAVFEVQVYYLSRIPGEQFTTEAIDRFRTGFVTLCNLREFASSIESTTKSLDRFESRFRLFRELVNRTFCTTIVDVPPLSRPVASS